MKGVDRFLSSFPSVSNRFKVMFEWYGSKHRDVWKVLKVSIKEKQISEPWKPYNKFSIAENPRRSIPIKYQSLPRWIRIKTLQCFSGYVTRLEGGY